MTHKRLSHRDGPEWWKGLFIGGIIMAPIPAIGVMVLVALAAAAIEPQHAPLEVEQLLVSQVRTILAVSRHLADLKG